MDISLCGNWHFLEFSFSFFLSSFFKTKRQKHKQSSKTNPHNPNHKEQQKFEATLFWELKNRRTNHQRKHVCSAAARLLTAQRPCLLKAKVSLCSSSSWVVSVCSTPSSSSSPPSSPSPLPSPSPSPWLWSWCPSVLASPSMSPWKIVMWILTVCSRILAHSS